MRVTSKGQVTIPAALRKKYGITPDVELTFEETERRPLLVLERDERIRRFCAALERMAGTADYGGMSTDEYMNLIRGYDEDEDDPGFAS